MTRTSTLALLSLCVIGAAALLTRAADAPALSASAAGFKSEVEPHPATDGHDGADLRLRYFGICDLTLEQAVELIRQRTHLNIIVEGWRVEAAGVERTRTVRLYLENIGLREAVRTMLDCYARDNGPLRMGERNGVLVISTPEGIAQTVTRCYDVRMLIEYAAAVDRGRPFGPETGTALPDGQERRSAEEYADPLRHQMQNAIDPDSWRDNGGSQGSIDYLAGRLFITHTPATHQRIAAWLKDVETELARPMSPSAAPATTRAVPAGGR